ncbi:hypothetical protein GGR52DRAFT_39643 [Hypoxylon sp. FL1284]|nr:hypothetical protein GGR52DRAFT_39643 [Hypoxylon sp. FL1284]
MAREKKKAPASARGVRAASRRAKLDRATQHDNAWRDLNPLKAAPPKLKHKTYFELVENADKKKKLEFKITIETTPPPGFEFVPIGHPNLTQACKDLSRDQDAMIFIVSNSSNPENLDHHMNRIGYHFRGTIVEQARMLVEDGQSTPVALAQHGVPEPIPETQDEINKQADAVLRDLFPRIPNIDRKEIIQHSFQKGGKFHGEFKVGMASGLTLARRVQLAAIAYIRHQHTRYDELLKTTSWANARRAVEKPCLNIIVKWRGDEETGRDQLDEILREVIEISDTEEDSEDDYPMRESWPARHADIVPPAALARGAPDLHDLRPAGRPSPPQARRRDPCVPSILTSSRQKAISKAERKNARKTQRFRRYAAAAEALAGSSLREDHAPEPNGPPTNSAFVDLTTSPGPARPTYPSREPTVVMTRGTPIVEQAPRHIELRADSQRFYDNTRRERATVAHRPPEGNTYAPSYDPKNHIPKAGHPPGGYNCEQIPVSPVRHGLQDMLLQSIEPASPASALAPRDVSRIQSREPRYFEEAPRIIPRGAYEPASSAPRLQSPGGVIRSHESGTTRYRVADHPAGQLDAFPRSSFVQINHQGQGEGPRHEPVRHFSDRQISSFGDPSQHQAWPVSSDRMSHYHDDTRIRNGAHAVVTNDASRQPHQVVGQHQADEGYQAASLRLKEIIRDTPARRDARAHNVQENAPVVYIREAPLQPRSPHGYYSVPASHPSRGLTTHERPNPQRTQAVEPRQQMVADVPLDHEYRGYREPPYSRLYGGEQVVWSDSASRLVRTVDSEFRHPEARYISSRHGFHGRSNPLPTPVSNMDQQQSCRHELVEPREEYQTYVNPSIRDNYVDGRGAPLRHYTPEPRRVIWVDR